MSEEEKKVEDTAVEAPAEEIKTAVSAEEKKKELQEDNPFFFLKFCYTVVSILRFTVFPGLFVIVSVVEPTLLKRTAPLALDGKSLANYLMGL